MPELKKNFSTLGVHGVCHLAPAGDLGFRVNARLRVECGVPLHDHRGLGDDQARRGTLGVVFRHERTRHMVCFGAAAGERCHENAIGHLEGAELEWLEE